MLQKLPFLTSMTGIASDHGGFELKEYIRENISDTQWKDYGCYSEDSIDYPDVAKTIANGILNNEVNTAVAICGTGIGISIALNRHQKVRAALCHDLHTTEMARMHNDANILTLGGRIIDKDLALEMVRVFLKTPFEGGRHERRVNKLDT